MKVNAESFKKKFKDHSAKIEQEVEQCLTELLTRELESPTCAIPCLIKLEGVAKEQTYLSQKILEKLGFSSVLIYNTGTVLIDYATVSKIQQSHMIGTSIAGQHTHTLQQPYILSGNSHGITTLGTSGNVGINTNGSISISNTSSHHTP